jgi:REP element-mobilizing transposase RayT
MGWPLRMFEPNHIVFTTVRCLHGRLLLRPSARTNDVLGGVLARAVRQFEVELFAFSFASNHLHLLVRAPKGNLPQFMQYLLSNISKKIGALVNWRGALWERRYSAEPVLDEGGLLDRLGYILSHGVKEGLVRRPEEWPGLSCLPDLQGEPPRQFRWFDWSQRWRARSGKGVPDRFDPRFAAKETLEVRPLPLSRFARPSAWRKFLKRLLVAVNHQGRREHPRVLGRMGVLAQDPHHRPERPKRSRRPWCHAVSARIRAQFKEQYLAFRAAFFEASQRWRRGDLSAVFPDHAFRPFLRPREATRVA